MSGVLPPPPRDPTTKPVWKRWWLWAIVVFVVLLIAGVAGSSPSEQTAAHSAAPATMPTAPPASIEASPESAPEMVRVPDVSGRASGLARATLRTAGFYVVLDPKLTNAAPSGSVLHQSLHAGARRPVGSTITLTVAKPLPKIPNVVGMSVAKAKKTLKKAGFGIAKVSQQVSSQTKGTVLSQTPAAGTPAHAGHSVALVIAKSAPIQPSPTNNCTPGYSPCLVYHGGADYDCAGGSGDGPYYAYQVEHVTGSDPYGLDADGDGLGCE